MVLILWSLFVKLSDGREAFAREPHESNNHSVDFYGVLWHEASLELN